MQQTKTLIVGASVSGLASAACLKKQGIDYIMIEKEGQVASPWRHHYERLHLHTNKSLSHLPYRKFDPDIPGYPSRRQVIDYLEHYQQAFHIEPVFHTEAKRIQRDGAHWITETNAETYRSSFIVIATGAYSTPKPLCFKGMESFPGKILHSYEYRSGANYKDKKVLVVGFGNSACEIALDLYEQGAHPSVAVRSAVNIVPRELIGIPIQRISQILSRLPVRVADSINAPLMRLLYGDITKLGLRKKPYGTFQQIKQEKRIPLLDIGTMKHIREGHITIYPDIDHIDRTTVLFTDGREASFDAIIAAIGYVRNTEDILQLDKSRYADLDLPLHKQRFFGYEGLYFCGFWISPRGHMREIALDAKRIAKNIAKKERTAPSKSPLLAERQVYQE